MASTKGNLLGSTVRVQTPYIQVTFGDINSGYTFGVYVEKDVKVKKNDGTFYNSKIVGKRFPNYIQSLDVTKINGQVNQYSLRLSYPIRPGDDPNYFEKIFSSISNTRKIIFTYGDMSAPDYIYKQEQAIITDIKTAFDLKGSSITYTIEAVSSAALGTSGCYSFNAWTDTKPSWVIRNVLLANNSKYHLLDIFYGMYNLDKVDALGLIDGSDAPVNISAKTNISALEYLQYLVSIMIDEYEPKEKGVTQSFYIMTVHDSVNGSAFKRTATSSNEEEQLGGPFFKITKVTKNVEHADAYEIDIGFPSGNLVSNFSIDNQETYSIFYNYQEKLNSDMTVGRLTDDGKLECVFSPAIASKNDNHRMNEENKTWWTKITQYPISASITITGLLRPALLMDYVRLNVIFPGGRKHISSGLYIVTKQRDSISMNGYSTQLNLTRIGGLQGDDLKYDY